MQLIHVSGHETAWAERFDAPLNEVFAIQDEITATVAGKLAVRIDDTRLEQARGRSSEKSLLPHPRPHQRQGRRHTFPRRKPESVSFTVVSRSVLLVFLPWASANSEGFEL